MKTIIVLGMGRSGTSMVAGILHILGVNMGERLLGAHWSNPLGHFEDLDFVELNEEILRAAGGSWDNPPAREAILAVAPRFYDRIRPLAEEERRRHEVWGWKDPRTSLTVELYLPHLENPYFIVCHRDWEAIARSLKRRDGMSIERGSGWPGCAMRGLRSSSGSTRASEDWTFATRTS
ncbi:hypothetical protein CF15_08305 [Pyrodictium occultum]|uniref:Sulfotransferase family protein n=1 Tax=Pyrodictium occultum TaxID=2309 RepID=A0A0V8RS39_PYROC|nr:hypothetical protein CF15_08305 [Pyrodictium occultum]